MFVEYYKGMIDAYKNVLDWIGEDDNKYIFERNSECTKLIDILDEEIEKIKEEQNL